MTFHDFNADILVCFLLYPWRNLIEQKCLFVEEKLTSKYIESKQRAKL